MGAFLTEYYLLIYVEEIIDIKNHHRTTNRELITVTENCQWMPKFFVGKRLFENRIFKQYCNLYNPTDYLLYKKKKELVSGEILWIT